MTAVVGHNAIPKAIAILLGINVGVNFGFVSVGVIDVGVQGDFVLTVGRTS